MVVGDETHILGSWLDQLFVRKCMSQEVNVTCNNFSTFFSDHDSVRVTIQ